MIYIMLQNYNLSELKDKSLFNMTVGEFFSLQEQLNSKCNENTTGQPNESKRYVYGYQGIADLFGYEHKSSGGRLKRSGDIDEAIIQVGRKIIVDAELALELARKKKGGRR